MHRARREELAPYRRLNGRGRPPWRCSPPGRLGNNRPESACWGSQCSPNAALEARARLRDRTQRPLNRGHSSREAMSQGRCTATRCWPRSPQSHLVQYRVTQGKPGGNFESQIPDSVSAPVESRLNAMSSEPAPNSGTRTLPYEGQTPTERNAEAKAFRCSRW